ncbi:hypothetical protein IK112_01370 [Candidatus Saccharibacteria bacterium]|nr:hypothetical protein [Candidatus Saccharibacteria bacterium]
MTETLKNSETSHNSVSTKWEQLSAVKFNEAPKQFEKEQNNKEENTVEKTEQLMLLKQRAKEKAKKPANEMSLEEVSSEYLDILMDLGENFTSPEGKTSRRVGEHGEIKFGRGYSDASGGMRNLIEATGKDIDFGDNGAKDADNFHYNNKYMDRGINLKMVDNIIRSESKWRKYGEEFAIANEQLGKAESALKEFANNEKQMGIFKRIFTIGKRNKEKKALQAEVEKARNTRDRVKKASVYANVSLREGLNNAYSEDYRQGHHKLSFEHSQEKGYADRMNEEYNEKFFSKDRIDKINRAIELRKQLQKYPKTRDV